MGRGDPGRGEFGVQVGQEGAQSVRTGASSTTSGARSTSSRRHRHEGPVGRVDAHLAVRGQHPVQRAGQQIAGRGAAGLRAPRPGTGAGAAGEDRLHGASSSLLVCRRRSRIRDVHRRHRQARVAGEQRPDGRPPAATTCAPTAAIIAPLSVHSPGRGTRRVRPAAAQRSSASARSRPLAATPPAIDHRADAQIRCGPDGLGGQHVDDRLLERRADVGDRDRPAGPLEALDVPGDRRLQAGEGEVVAASPAVRSARAGRRSRPDRRRAASRSITGPPGIAEAEQPGDLVVGLAGRVVDGAADLGDVAGQVVDPQQLGVAARDQQRQRRCPAAGRAPGCRRRRARPGGSPRTAARPRPPHRPWPRRLRRAARRPARGRRSPRSRRRRPVRETGVVERRAARWASSPPGGRGRRSPAPPRRTGRARPELDASAWPSSSGAPSVIRTRPAPVSSQEDSMPSTMVIRGRPTFVRAHLAGLAMVYASAPLGW